LGNVSQYFVGLMSGTSLDGIDAVLVELTPDPTEPLHLKSLHVKAHSHRPFHENLRQELLALNTPGGVDELHRSQWAADQLARLSAELTKEISAKAKITLCQVCAIGAHGQTVRHLPPGSTTPGDVNYTLQLNNPALLAELTGTDVVADFRSSDIAAGGQGAPLVPAFHKALFSRINQTRVILNLGGISNVTILHASGEVQGFDCGPANMLMDAWCLRHTGQAFDANGQWGAQGQIVPQLLSSMLAESFFAASPPKSTGRDLFNAAWLDAHIQKHVHSNTFSPQDVQATLCELTARSCAQEIKRHACATQKMFVCGGGALNAALMARLANHLSPCQVQPTDALGLPAMQVEACAFAWLAYVHVHRLPGNLTAVTGARGPRVLGALYPGG
jgi:anhydro-N-acetylmuramic acid kinase